MEPNRAAVMLEKAQADLAVVLLFEDHRGVTDEQFGFHCQQAIEKAMKSVLGRMGIEYPWTHDLTRLLLLLDANSILFPPRLREADLYSLFAVRFRYENLPNESAGGKRFDRPAARQMATLAVEWATAAAQGK